MIHQSEQQHEAAMAVLAAMYGASKPSLSELTDMQLVQAVLVADMLQLPDVI